VCPLPTYYFVLFLGLHTQLERRDVGRTLGGTKEGKFLGINMVISHFREKAGVVYCFLQFFFNGWLQLEKKKMHIQYLKGRI